MVRTVVFSALVMIQASASLVVYRTPAAELQQLTATLHTSTVTWVLVDNSANEGAQAEARKALTLKFGGHYIAAPRNVGFGAGHNLALTYLKDAGSEQPYHLIVNPDIAFDGQILARLQRIFEERPDVGWIMPEVRSEDGTVQPLCKLLPTPVDLLGRRFVPGFLRRSLGIAQEYELGTAGAPVLENVPFLSGCFVFARLEMLQKAGGFAPGYFMYMEDVDLSRRFRAFGKLLYWPDVHVVHGHHRGSYHDLGLMFIHVRSAIRYFNRWGWFSDPDREQINAQALRSRHTPHPLEGHSHIASMRET